MLDGLRLGPPALHQVHRLRPEERRRPRGREADSRRAPLDARPPRGAGRAGGGDRRPLRPSTGSCWSRTSAGGDTDIFNEPVFPRGEQRGFGFHEAPRGTLSHWVVIKDGKIDNYQAVVPSTWNAGPRDDRGSSRGPTRRRSWATRWPIPIGRSRSCGRSTPSIPASRAPSTPTMRTAERCRGSALSSARDSGWRRDGPASGSSASATCCRETMASVPMPSGCSTAATTSRRRVRLQRPRHTRARVRRLSPGARSGDRHRLGPRRGSSGRAADLRPRRDPRRGRAREAVAPRPRPARGSPHGGLRRRGSLLGVPRRSDSLVDRAGNRAHAASARGSARRLRRGPAPARGARVRSAAERGDGGAGPLVGAGGSPVARAPSRRPCGTGDCGALTILSA